MRIDFHKKFVKQFYKQPKKIQEKFYTRLEIFSRDQFDPILNNHRVHHPYDGFRSINITGDLRALYDTSGNTIIFIHIGTHSELYN
ncbi:type II toxin-antitoxin system YafQ family toxin [Candidatus Nomurabacteria bacterium]|nr:type II toxin-antitoxin system YafQ family toxin [Candidatus Nomurabacteria bacterium]